MEAAHLEIETGTAAVGRAGDFCSPWKGGFSEDKTKYRFKHDGHKFTLYKRGDGPNWYIKFRHGGRQIPKSLETGNVDAARQRAVQQFKDVKSPKWEDRQAAEQRKLKEPPVTGLDLVAAYEAGYTRLPDPPSRESARANVLNLRRLIEYAGLKLSSPIKELLTEETVDEFRAGYLKPAGEDMLKREARKRGGNSVLRQARAIFSEQALRVIYRGLAMPDLAGFKKAEGFAAKEAFKTPLDEQAIQMISTAALDLRGKQPALYLAHLLYRHCAMRNSEIEAARWGWLSLRPDGGGWMTIAQTNERDTKGAQGRLPVARDVMSELLSLRGGLKDEEFIVAARHLTERDDIVNREHSAWLKPMLPASQTQKTNYRLRDWGYTLIANKYSLDAAKMFARHALTALERAYLRGFDWQRAAQRIGEDPAMCGITLADAGLG